MSFKVTIFTVGALFLVPMLFLVLIRSRVSEQDMAGRRTLAEFLASREWTSPKSGRITEGGINISDLPPPSVAKAIFMNALSDTFQTYTIFEFGKKGKPSIKVQVADHFYQIRLL